MKEAIRADDKTPLQWAKNWTRTPIAERKDKKVWKKTFAFYRDRLVDQLAKSGAGEILITYNSGDDQRRDPGVTVYFSKPMKPDYSWQHALGIDNPLPRLEEIDDAFRKKAAQHHPDRGGDVEIFRSLTRHREQAKAWVLNAQRSDHEMALPCDRFTELRWNVAALCFGLQALRRLEEYGLPGMLERAFKGFRTAIEDQSNGATVTTGEAR